MCNESRLFIRTHSHAFWFRTLISVGSLQSSLSVVTFRGGALDCGRDFPVVSILSRAGTTDHDPKRPQSECEETRPQASHFLPVLDGSQGTQSRGSRPLSRSHLRGYLLSMATLFRPQMMARIRRLR